VIATFRDHASLIASMANCDSESARRPPSRTRN